MLQCTVTLGTHSINITPEGTGSPSSVVAITQTTKMNVALRELQPYKPTGYDLAFPVLPAGIDLEDFFPPEPHWVVEIDQSDASNSITIPMGRVTNQGSWVNSQAGANIALAAIQALIP